MTADEVTFLRDEFKVNWDHLNRIEDRRYLIFQYYSAFLGVAITASVAILKDSTSSNSFFTGLSCMTFLLMTFSLACHSVLAHERQANLRYRDRINQIRNAFLGRSEDVQILSLLAYHPTDGYIETAKTRKPTHTAIFAFRRVTTAGVFGNFIAFWGCLALLLLVVALTSLACPFAGLSCIHW